MKGITDYLKQKGAHIWAEGYFKTLRPDFTSSGFENKNKNMEDYRKRLEVEKQELNDRIDSLHSFITSDLYDDINPVQMSLLNIQLEAMRTYSQTLVERIAWLENS